MRTEKGRPREKKRGQNTERITIRGEKMKMENIRKCRDWRGEEREEVCAEEGRTSEKRRGQNTTGITIRRKEMKMEKINHDRREAAKSRKK